MAYSNSLTGRLQHYRNMRSIPAVLSVAFVAASLYQFGGISTVDLVWISYQLTAEHAAIGSVAIYAVAFMSSETSDFDRYEVWEQALIIAAPALILGEQYLQEVTDLLLTLGDPLGYQVAFVVTLLGWGVAVGK